MVLQAVLVKTRMNWTLHLRGQGPRGLMHWVVNQRGYGKIPADALRWVQDHYTGENRPARLRIHSARVVRAAVRDDGSVVAGRVEPGELLSDLELAQV